MAPRGGRRENVLDADLSFDLERLFDPYNFDHIQKNDRLALFKQRDLPHVRHYKAAVKIFGGPPHRTRQIVAPPMETPLKHRLGLYQNVFTAPGPPNLNGPLKPPPEPIKQPTDEERAIVDENNKISKYKKWISERKQLRSNLDNLGLNENFLARKPDKSELEKRVQAKYRRDRLWKPESPPPVEITPEPTPLPDVPSLTVPPPDGLQILDKFLSLNKMRLMDLFRMADKDKSWTISRAEFLAAVTQCEMTLSESEVDDIIITLDANNDDELDYQEINKGLTQWRKNRRELKRQGIEPKSARLAAQGMGKQSHDSIKRPSREQSFDKTTTTGTEKSSRGTNKGISRERSMDKIPESTSRATNKLNSREHSLEKITSVDKSSKSRELSFVNMDSTSKTTPTQTPRGKESRESKKNLPKEGLVRENTLSSKIKEDFSDMKFSREKSNVSLSKLSSKDHSIPGSRQRNRLSDVMSSNLPMSRENQSLDKTADDTLPMDSALERSLYEDALFQSHDTPRATTTHTAPDTGEVEGSRATNKKSSSRGELSRVDSRKLGSATSERSNQSRASTPNSLVPPDFDVRDETRAPESAEAMVDIRKHDRVVLTRSAHRRSLSREQKVVFDELPGVIKVGYKPIDDHCSESTLGEGGAEVNQFRREKLKEYFEVKKLCEETGLPFTPKTLDRVLLYPGDLPFNQIKKSIALPLGPLTNEVSPFNQPKPKKKSKKRRRGMGRVSKSSGGGSMAGSKSGVESDGERTGSGGSKRSYITVEDIYPFAQNVAPKIYKENLSSGRALISRKVDNWMTFEEYSKYTQNLPNRFRNLNRRSDPDAAWPGYVLDKLRLCMPPYNNRQDAYGRPLLDRDSCVYEGHGTGLYDGSGYAVFRSTAQPKRAYPGYNNDLLTWPVSEHGVRYGNIDEHRLVK